jgi:ferredoxin-type protein NapH
VFLLVLILGRFDWFPWVKGSTAATRLFGVLWLADPMAGLEVTLATRHLHEPLLVAAGLLLLFYALLGRVFCGWVCPLGLLLDLNDDLRGWARGWLRRRGIRLPEVQFPLSAKYWLLGLALVLSLIAQLPVFQLISPINILARALIFAPGPGLFLIAGILVLEYASRRAWCRALCPLGAFYSLVGRFGRVQVLVDQEKERAGKACGLCTLHCPMGIRVLEDHILRGKLAIDDPECTRCGSCVDPCPRNSLRLGVKGPAFRLTVLREGGPPGFDQRGRSALPGADGSRRPGSAFHSARPDAGGAPSDG